MYVEERLINCCTNQFLYLNEENLIKMSFPAKKELKLNLQSLPEALYKFQSCVGKFEGCKSNRSK